MYFACERREKMMNSKNAVEGNDRRLLFENLVWLSSVDLAIYLRKFRKDGSPSVEAIRQLVYRGKLKPRKLGRSLYFKKSEVDRAIEFGIL